MTAVMTVMSVVRDVRRAGTRKQDRLQPVAATGMVLFGSACLVLTQVSVDGNYLDDMFFGLLIFGTGLGFAFVASQIAALAGIAEEESGLAAGLVDTSFNIGGAIGIATLTTVAVSRTNDVLGDAGAEEPASLRLNRGLSVSVRRGDRLRAVRTPRSAGASRPAPGGPRRADQHYGAAGRAEAKSRWTRARSRLTISAIENRRTVATTKSSSNETQIRIAHRRLGEGGARTRHGLCHRKPYQRRGDVRCATPLAVKRNRCIQGDMGAVLL